MLRDEIVYFKSGELMIAGELAHEVYFKTNRALYSETQENKIKIRNNVFCSLVIENGLNIKIYSEVPK